MRNKKICKLLHFYQPNPAPSWQFMTGHRPHFPAEYELDRYYPELLLDNEFDEELGYI
jgi:hypothetical protein